MWSFSWRDFFCQVLSTSFPCFDSPARMDHIVPDSSGSWEAKNRAALVQMVHYGVASLFGVGLIDPHFPVASNAKLVEKDGTSCAWESKSAPKPRQIVPTSWLAIIDEISPYEFFYFTIEQRTAGFASRCKHV